MRDISRSKNINYKFLLLSVAVGFLFLLFSWVKLAPLSAPTWLHNTVEIITSRMLTTQITSKSIEIAIVVDDTAYGKPGAMIVNAINMAVSEINLRGGTGGRRITVQVYEDEDDDEKAKAIAHQIVTSDASVVIGHRSSTTSAVAGPIYMEAGIPVVTPTATSPIVTKDNPWYFRMVGTDDRSGRFLASYVNAVLRPDKMLLVTESDVYAKGLSKSFSGAASELGVTMMPTVRIGASIDASIDTIVKVIKKEQGPVTIFFAMYPSNAIPIIEKIRSQNIQNVSLIVPDAFLAPEFINAFNKPQNNTRKPGFYYTDNITLSTPFIYEVAGRAAGIFYSRFSSIYHYSPDWRAAFAYDAAHLIGETIEEMLKTIKYKNSSKSESSQSGIKRHTQLFELDDKSSYRKEVLREGIRQQLLQFNSVNTAFSGVTGPVFFNEDGDSQVIPSIARLKDGQAVSGLHQYKVTRELTRGQMNNFKKLVEIGRIIELDGIQMEKLDVVFTGIALEEIDQINTLNKTAHIKGSIWFRYSSNMITEDKEKSPANIHFLNAVSEVVITQSIVEKVWDETHYEVLEFSGVFTIDFVANAKRFNKPIVGVSFKHVKIPISNLIYVVDYGGMGLRQGRSFVDSLEPMKAHLTNIGWKIDDGAVYQEPIWRSGLGNPKHLRSSAGEFAQSSFFSFARLSSNTDFASALFSDNVKAYIFLIAGATFLIVILWQAFLRGFTGILLPLIIQFISLFLTLWFGKQISIDILQKQLPFEQLDILLKVFESLMWIVGAFFVKNLLHRVIWSRIERRSKHKIPALIKGMDKIIIYVLAFMGILAFVLDQPINNLLATTGLLGLILGLALQGNLANIFSGIVLSIERPFKVGDVVEIDGMGKMRVEDMTWRSVRLGVGTSKQVAIPNSTVASEIVINHTKLYPANQKMVMTLPVGINVEEAVKLIKSCVIEIGLPFGNSECEVSFSGVFADKNLWYAAYSVYWISENPERDAGDINLLWTAVWKIIGGQVTKEVKLINQQNLTPPSKPVIESQVLNIP